MSLRLALIADTFPPHRSSGAVQLRDLSREFVRQGHQLTVILPAPYQKELWRIEDFDNVELLRCRAPKTKDVNYAIRSVNEFLMPFSMRRAYRDSPLSKTRWDGVLWYSPSIFHGPLVQTLRRESDCKSYLIIRDIFPEWAVDMGVMGRGLPYWAFRAVARRQYAVADTIGVQTEGNCTYFRKWQAQPGRHLEVLHNWLGDPAVKQCSIQLGETKLAGRKIFVYAGNMGVAQGIRRILDLAERFQDNPEVGFLFVGRGSEADWTRQAAARLTNALFFDEIDPDEIPDLYAQCGIGIVALAQQHESHNIPGKFLSYMQCGLPTLANINAGNDLAGIIRQNGVGQVCESNDIDELEQQAQKLLRQISDDKNLQGRCRQLFAEKFTARAAVHQIVKRFTGI